MSIWDEEELKNAAKRLCDEAGIPLPEKQPEPKKILTHWDILMEAPTIRNGPFENAAAIVDQWAAIAGTKLTTEIILGGAMPSRAILTCVTIQSSLLREYLLPPSERQRLLDLGAMVDHNFREKVKKNTKVSEIYNAAMVARGM